MQPFSHYQIDLTPYPLREEEQGPTVANRQRVRLTTISNGTLTADDRSQADGHAQMNTPSC